jgi:hypothetical protein
MRGIANPLSDVVLEKDRTIRTLVARLERRRP